MPCWRFQALYKIREPFTIYLLSLPSLKVWVCQHPWYKGMGNRCTFCHWIFPAFYIKSRFLWAPKAHIYRCNSNPDRRYVAWLEESVYLLPINYYTASVLYTLCCVQLISIREMSPLSRMLRSRDHIGLETILWSRSREVLVSVSSRPLALKS